MTVRIQVKQLLDYNRQNQLIQLQVSGGKAGNLQSATLEANRFIWNPHFVIDASQNDILKFSMFSVSYAKRDLIGQAVVCCTKLVKIYQKQEIRQIPFQYELDICCEEKKVGGLSIDIMYERGLLFEGELLSQIKLSLSKQKEPLDMFRGKCASKNAFSFMDESATGQYCKFTQSIYRDFQ